MLRCIVTLVVLFPVAGQVEAQTGPPSVSAETIKAGMIGLDTSHVIAFTRLVNDPKAQGYRAMVKIVAGYPNGVPDNPASRDRVGKYTEQLRQQGIEICECIEELLAKVDVVLIESVDGRPHLEQARKVIAAGKPFFVDKPMAASLEDVLEIFRLAQEAGVPCWSSSALRFTPAFQEARQGKPFGRVKECLAWSPLHTEPHHPDLFWYGIHGVEILFTIMGPGCKEVRRVSFNRVEGTWQDGRKGIFEGRNGYGARVVGENGEGELGRFEGYEGLVEEICKFFVTKKPPVDPEETIEIYAFMQAADVSKQRGGEPVSIAEVIDEAKKKQSSIDIAQTNK